MSGQRTLLLTLCFLVLAGGCRRGRPHASSSRTHKGQWTALHLAARNDHAEVVRALLAQGADVNARNDSGQTPLHEAAYEASKEMVELLIAGGADVRAKDNSGNTPLHCALQEEGRGEVVGLLIRHGADVTAKDLAQAARQGYVTPVQLILAKGIDVNSRSRSGVTPLHLAAQYAQKDMVELLLEKGADVQAAGEDGWTALHYAVHRYRKGVAECLLKHGAHVDALTRHRESPLFLAVTEGQKDMVEMLIARGADVHYADEHGQTYLHVAAAEGQDRIAQLLIEQGVSVNAVNQQGQTPLHCATLSTRAPVRTDVMNCLLPGAADVDARTPSGCTALHYAAREGNVRAVELLLAYGADVNARAETGRTPLHFAVRKGDRDIVELLLEKGADAAAADRDGMTALQCARAAGREDLALLLTGRKPAAPVADSESEVPSDTREEALPVNAAEPLTDLQRLVPGNSAFALDLYARLKSSEGNIVFSPYSISTGLAVTYAGARGNTEKEMARALHFSVDQQKLHPAFAALQAGLNKVQEAGNVSLHVANSLWPQEGHPFLPEYLSLTERYYGVSITPVDYRTEAAREATRQTINKWVEGRTQEKIKDLIPAGQLGEMTRLVLVNAIYFRGAWKNKFDMGKTEDAAFHTSARESVQVPMMHREETFRYGVVGSVQVLELPYRGGELSMLVLLPRRIEGLGQLEQSLSLANLDRWRNCLSRTKILVCLPRFQMVFGAELKEMLTALGMVSAFQAAADLTGMDGEESWLSLGAVIHKAFITVNEEGTEAAAATAVEALMTGYPLPPRAFWADHPFLFLIQENRTGSILFLGRVTDPTKSGS